MSPSLKALVTARATLRPSSMPGRSEIPCQVLASSNSYPLNLKYVMAFLPTR